MSTELIIGRAKSGKSHYLQEKVESIHAQMPKTNIYYLTPEQTTFSVEYALSSSEKLHGLGMIEVLSFERLSQKIFTEYGAKSRIIVDDLGKMMLLRKVIGEHSDELPHFRLALKQFGYLKTISDTLDELNRSASDASIIAASLAKEHPARLLTAKAAEIALIQTVYNQSLLQAARLDKSNLLSELTEFLQQNTILADDIIIVDGFEYFTKQQLLLLEEIIKQAKETYISICYEGKKDNALFQKQLRNLKTLQEICAAVSSECKIVQTDYQGYYQAEALKFLAQNYTQGAYAVFSGADLPLEIIECQNPKTETELVAVIIRYLLREKNLRYKDIAVMAADLEIYQKYLAKSFALYDIPYFLDENSRIFSHPLLELLDAVFAINDSNWSYQSVFGYLRSSLVCLEAEEIDMLDNYCLSAGIHGAKNWLSPKPWLWQGKRSDWEKEVLWDEEALFHLNDIRKRAAAPIAALLKNLRRKQNVRASLSVIVEFLVSLQVPQQLEKWQNEALANNDFTLAQIHGQIWETTCSIFDQLAEICGEEIMDISELGQLLSAALKNITLGKIPLGLDQIFVGTPKRSRLDNVKAVILLGANEDLIPGKVNGTSVFTLAELNILKRWGLADTLEKIYDEEFSIYKTLTAAEGYLYLTVSLADIKGKAQRRSAVINKMEKLFPALSVQSEEKFYQAHYMDRLLSLSAALTAEGANTDNSAAVLSWYREHNPAQVEALNRMLAHPSQTTVPLRSYSNILNLSVSAIEKYRACPYAYFLNYTLHLKERDIYSLDAMNTGQFYHKAMEELTNSLLCENLDWGTVSDEHLDAMISEIIERLLPQLKNEILLSQGRYRFIKDKLSETITMTAHNLAIQSRKGSFRTLKSEYAFGYGNNDFTVELTDGTKIRLQGRIDLIEQAQGKKDNYLRIIDFKSGANDLPLAEVYYGLKIQLLVYLKAALKTMPSYKSAGVLYQYIKNPFINGKNKLSPAEAEKLYLKEIKPKGLLLGKFEPLYLADNTLLDTQASDILPIKLKKDGQEYLKSYGLLPPEDKDLTELFDQYSAVASQSQFDALEKHIDKIILETGMQILNGEFAPSPYRYKSQKGCDYCRYGSICRINTQKETPYRNLAKISRQEIWQNIEEAD